MRILFDQGTPAPLRNALPGHLVEAAYERGWSTLSNGNLLAEAEAASFELFVTTDQNLSYQQNLTEAYSFDFGAAHNRWPIIQQHTTEIIQAIDSIQPGEFREVTW